MIFAAFGRSPCRRFRGRRGHVRMRCLSHQANPGLDRRICITRLHVCAPLTSVGRLQGWQYVQALGRHIARFNRAPFVPTDHMLLVIDNYDSFTYNLVQYLGELGAEVVVRRNDAVTVEEIGVMAPAAIVLSPGPCAPAQAGVTVDVIRAWGSTIPILGVCLGHQAIGVA